MSDQPEVISRTRETRRRAAEIIKTVPVPSATAQAQAWTLAQLKMQGLLAEQTAAVAEALEAIRDIALAVRASMPLYAVEQS